MNTLSGVAPPSPRPFPPLPTASETEFARFLAEWLVPGLKGPSVARARAHRIAERAIRLNRGCFPDWFVREWCKRAWASILKGECK